MRDLHELGLRGRLPNFIENLLSGRRFRVRVGKTPSSVFSEEQGDHREAFYLSPFKPYTLSHKSLQHC